MPPEPPGLQAVLFDMDGTLVDTEPVWFAAEVDVMAARAVIWTHHHQAVAVGGPIERVARYMADLVADSGQPRPDPTTIQQDLIEAFHRRLATADLRYHEGARLLYTHAMEAGLRCAVVSNSPRRLLDPMLAANPDIAFELSVAGDEVSPNKPHPTPYLTAADILGVEISRCLVVEDSPTGVAAGRSSGAYVLAIGDGEVLDPGPRGIIAADIGHLTFAEISDRLGALNPKT